MAETAPIVGFDSCIGRSPTSGRRQWGFLCFVAAAALMTPFGAKIRGWRQSKNRTLHQQAEALGVSAAYLSALENGFRGHRPFLLIKFAFG